MNRGERREVSKRKWISRAKRIYNSFFYKNRYMYDLNRTKKHCESITDFLDNSKYAKILKDTTVIKSYSSDKLEVKIKNRKDRHKSKLILKYYGND